MIYEMKELHELENYIGVVSDMQRLFRVAIKIARELLQEMKYYNYDFNEVDKRLYLNFVEDMLKSFKAGSLETLESNTKAESVTKALSENLKVY